MTPAELLAVETMVADVVDDVLACGVVLMAESAGKTLTVEQGRAVVRTRDERVFAAALALADEWQATYDRWADVPGAPPVDIFRAHATRLRKALGR